MSKGCGDVVLEKFLEVNSLFLAIFGVSVYGSLKKILSIVKVKQETKLLEKETTDKRIRNLEKANVAILHNKIYRQCTEHLIDEHISLADMDDLDYLFSAYKSLGGNGTGEDLYNEVRRLPKIKKEGNKK